MQDVFWHEASQKCQEHGTQLAIAYNKADYNEMKKIGGGEALSRSKDAAFLFEQITTVIVIDNLKNHKRLTPLGTWGASPWTEMCLWIALTLALVSAFPSTNSYGTTANT